MLNYKLLSVFSRPIMIFLMLIMAPLNANGTVNVDKSRVIFNSGDLSANLSLHNSEKESVLLQLWTDSGNPYVTPDKSRTPIIVNPPIFIMSAGEIRNIRLILASGKELPQDRESLFWLNVFQIPPNTNQISKGKQKIVLPLRLRLKVFVRPNGVEKIVAKNYDEIVFTSINASTLKITNPTKWYVTFTSLRIDREERKSLLLKPFSNELVHVPNLNQSKKSVSYDVIDDDGTILNYLKKID